MRELRAQVRRSGLAGSDYGQWGRATYIGKSSNGEDIYRVIFGSPGFERSGKFRASDLRFESFARLAKEEEKG